MLLSLFISLVVFGVVDFDLVFMMNNMNYAMIKLPT